MRQLREQRLWTALVITGLCGYAISEAAPLFHFGVEAMTPVPETIRSNLKTDLSESSAGPLAQQLVLTIAPPTDPDAHAVELTRLLSATPMSGGAWLDLAMARQNMQAPPQHVLAALTLSSLTAPNEARIMAGRALFGLTIWTKLPSNFRRSVIHDLVGGWVEINVAQRDDLDSVLTIETDQTREEIRAALMLEGPTGQAIIANLDLIPQPPVSKDDEPPIVDPPTAPSSLGGK